MTLHPIDFRDFAINRLKVKYTTSLVLVFMTTICACRRTDNVELSTKNEVVVGVADEMQTLNPLLASNVESSWVHSEIWQSLNTLHPKKYRLMPVLASLPKISEDKLTYTYTLDNRAKWADGVQVTAADVIFTFKSILNPAAHADAARGNMLDLDSVWSPGEGKVCFHFKVAIFNWDYYVGTAFILPKHLFDSARLTDRISWQALRTSPLANAVLDAGQTFSGTEKSADITKFIGSGPYVFQEWRRGEQIVLRKNKNYWAGNIPWLEAYPDRIVYRMYHDVQFAGLKTKEIDILRIGTASYLSDLDSVKWHFIKKDTVYNVSYSCIGWNLERPIFRSKKVRTALTMLVNRCAMVTSLMHGLGKTIEGPVSPLQPDFDPSVKQPGYDPTVARKLLEEDGWHDSDGDGILDKVIDGRRVAFRFTFLSLTKNNALLVFIEDLRKVGIEATIYVPDWSVYKLNRRSRAFDACYVSMTNDPVETDFFSYFHSSQAQKGEWNYSCFSNKDADQIIEQHRTELDISKRILLSHQLQHIIAEELPQTFLYAGPTKYAWVDRFDNVFLEALAPTIDPRYLIVRGSGVKPIQY